MSIFESISEKLGHASEYLLLSRTKSEFKEILSSEKEEQPSFLPEFAFCRTSFRAIPFPTLRSTTGAVSTLEMWAKYRDRMFKEGA